MRVDSNRVQTLDTIGQYTRQWGAQTHGGRFATEPLPGDDAAREKRRIENVKHYKEKWSHVSLAKDVKRGPPKLVSHTLPLRAIQTP